MGPEQGTGPILYIRAGTNGNEVDHGEEKNMKSIIIKNGKMIDIEQGKLMKADIAVEGDRIIEIAPEISSSAVSEIDASGCIVTPGLIDHHTHIYPLAKIGIPGSAACFASGVTTAVDAGSTGCDTYEKYRSWIKAEKLGIRAYLNVCSNGLDNLPESMEDVDPSHMNVEKIQDTFDKYGSELLGLKLRTSRNIVKEFGWKPLEKAVEIGEKVGVPLMVHITNPPGPLPELFGRLRSGDIVTHMYQNTGFHLLDDEGKKVSEAAWKARERGIIFEAADARAHFSFQVSEKAIHEKFYPDILGTDITKLSMHLRPTSFNMAMQISKYTFLGIPFEKVIQMATWNSAVSMNMEKEIGNLKEGMKADIAVFRPCAVENIFGDRPYTDANRKLRKGDRVYEPVLTVKNGEMVYRSVLF